MRAELKKERGHGILCTHYKGKDKVGKTGDGILCAHYILWVPHDKRVHGCVDPIYCEVIIVCNSVLNNLALRVGRNV